MMRDSAMYAKLLASYRLSPVTVVTVSFFSFYTFLARSVAHALAVGKLSVCLCTLFIRQTCALW